MGGEQVSSPSIYAGIGTLLRPPAPHHRWAWDGADHLSPVVALLCALPSQRKEGHDGVKGASCVFGAHVLP